MALVRSVLVGGARGGVARRLAGAVAPSTRRVAVAAWVQPVALANAAPLRCFCAAPGGGAGPEAAGAEASSSAKQPRSDAPMVAKVAQGAKTGIKGVFWVGIGGLCLTSLYFVSRELMPTSMSPNTVFGNATEVLKGDPEVSNKFAGEIKTYGMDPGGRREGRRFFIPEHRYEKDGISYLRVVFTVEGERGMKGKVYAEVSSKPHQDFNYLIVQLQTGECLSIIDNREPEKPLEMVQSEVAMALQVKRATFYGDGPMNPTTRAQMNVLGDSWSLIKYVRCDEDQSECERAGVVAPGWIIDGEKHQGVLPLQGLKNIVAKK